MLMGDHRLRVSENKVLRRHVDGRDRQKQQSTKNCTVQELHDLYSSPNIFGLPNQGK